MEADADALRVGVLAFEDGVMRETFGMLCAALAAIGFFGLALEAFHDWARSQGFKEGYALGKLATDSWLLKVEEDVDQVRQQIWREEAEL